MINTDSHYDLVVTVPKLYPNRPDLATEGLFVLASFVFEDHAKLFRDYLPGYYGPSQIRKVVEET